MTQQMSKQSLTKKYYDFLMILLLRNVNISGVTPFKDHIGHADHGGDKLAQRMAHNDSFLEERAQKRVLIGPTVRQTVDAKFVIFLGV